MNAEESIRTAWEKAKPYIEPATKHGDYSIDMIEEKVLSGKWMLWLGDKGAATTEIFDNDLGRCMSINYCGGDLHEMLERYPFMERMAKEIGCVKLYLMGRPGWYRVFERYGYKQEHIIGKKL